MCIPRWDDFNFIFKVFEGEKRQEFVIVPFPTDYNDEIPLSDLENEINKGLFSFILFALLALKPFIIAVAPRYKTNPKIGITKPRKIIFSIN